MSNEVIPSTPRLPQGRVPEWFTEARFGVFIHWGLYSLAARHEWVMTREQISPADYHRYFEQFDPDLFDARAWARQVRAAGARYVVFTTKHHEGFCLWDSQLTDYKVTNTRVGRDLLAEFIAAARVEGLRIGLYHSLIDWHHEDFTIDALHPLRGQPDAAKLNETKDMARYRAYLHGHVRELLTEYGEIDYLFFDYSYDPADGWEGKGHEDWGSKELTEMIRELAPGIIVNDRLGLPGTGFSGNLVTPEQYQPGASFANDGQAWEACQTMNGSWGYDRDNHDMKSVGLLVRMLIDSVSRGGNMLLNVGPNGRGEFAPADAATLAGVGEWLRLHERAIRGAGPSEMLAPADARFTRRRDRLYLHLFAWPFGQIHLPGLADQVQYAQFLHDASEVRLSRIDPEQRAAATIQPGQAAGTLTLTLPVMRPDVAVPVIELVLS